MKKISLFLISLVCMAISNIAIANEVAKDRAFSNNCDTHKGAKKRIYSITLGNQEINTSEKRAYYTITLFDTIGSNGVEGMTGEISVLESVGNDYGKAMFKLINNAYLSNSYIEITRCESNRIAGLKTMVK